MQQKEIEKNKKLVFAIIEHPYWGFIIEAYSVIITKKQQFSYNVKKVTKHNVNDFFDSLDNANNLVIDMLDNYSDNNIIKVFGKHKERAIDFFKRLELPLVENFIRPFIEKHLSKIINVISDNDIPLYYKGNPGNLINDNPIKILKDIVEPIFNFEKQSDKTRYYLTLKAENQYISLKDQNTLVLSNFPCIIMMNNTIYRFDGHFDSKKLKPFFNKEYIEIPPNYQKKYFESFIKRTISQYKVTATGFNIEEIHSNPTPFLSLEVDYHNKAVLEISFKYDADIFFSPLDKELCKVKLNYSFDNDYYFKKIIRNLEKEKRYIETIQYYGLEKINSCQFTLKGIKNGKAGDGEIKMRHNIVDWMATHKDVLIKKGVNFTQNHLHEKYFIGKPEITLKIDEKSDWFDLKGFVFFGKHKIPFIELKNNIIKGEREFLLPDGTIGLIPVEWMEKYNDVLKFAKKEKGCLSLNKHYFTILKNLDLVKKEEKTLGVPLKKANIPSSLKAEMRPYQLTGFQWLVYLQYNKLGGCLADDMGLGKTLQALAALLKLRDSYNSINQNSQNTNTPDSYNENHNQLNLFDNFTKSKQNKQTSLIVMPLSLIHNWVNEIEKFAPSLKVFKYVGINRPKNTNIFSKYDIIITTYGIVRSDIDILKEFHFSYIILDESQIIKNSSSKIFLAVKKLNGKYRLVLTGTPIENSLTDLWSQFSFLNPGMLGSLRSFKEEFVIPIEKENDKQKRDKLQNLIKPFVLRRNKNHVAKELPDMIKKVHYCEMTEEQASFYERKKSEARNMILENFQTMGKTKTKFLLLSSLTQLRLIANHPVIIENNYEYDSGKFKEVLHNVSKVISENHKVLLFSQFVKHLNLYANYFKQHDIPFGMLTGRVNEKDRKPIIDRFHNDTDTQIFLISMRAGGTGLNLTGADYVFMLDPWWNPAVEAQAISRAHRIGQDKKVFVYKFISRSSVEEKIMALQKHKSKISDMFINQNNPLKLLQMDEIITLL